MHAPLLETPSETQPFIYPLFPLLYLPRALELVIVKRSTSVP